MLNLPKKIQRYNKPEKQSEAHHIIHFLSFKITPKLIWQDCISLFVNKQGEIGRNSENIRPRMSYPSIILRTEGISNQSDGAGLSVSNPDKKQRDRQGISNYEVETPRETWG